MSAHHFIADTYMRSTFLCRCESSFCPCDIGVAASQRSAVTWTVDRPPPRPGIDLG